ncbi:MAG: AbrB family transcriptional regulator [Legionellaceae bacterium]|nr:AbrB family transcriptional regulator [Legionellaceae bacterium]|tara:strand:- start:163 stop:372 length:210 start_codon:yes stop_codon:yes gene_type:complete
MNSAILSSKFQVCIPKQVREELNLHAGQQLIFVTKGQVIHLVPKVDLKDMRGLLSGANTKNVRDRRDRV